MKLNKNHRKNSGFTLRRRRDQVGYHIGTNDTYNYFVNTMDTMDNLRVPRR